MMEDLLAIRGLRNAPDVEILYVGSSSGGIGVLNTIDFVREHYFDRVKFFGGPTHRPEAVAAH